MSRKEALPNAAGGGAASDSQTSEADMAQVFLPCLVLVIRRVR